MLGPARDVKADLCGLASGSLPVVNFAGFSPAREHDP